MIFAAVKLFNLLVGFKELNKIKGNIKINININAKLPPKDIFLFNPIFSPICLSSQSLLSQYVSNYSEPTLL